MIIGGPIIIRSGQRPIDKILQLMRIIDKIDPNYLYSIYHKKLRKEDIKAYHYYNNKSWRAKKRYYESIINW